MRREAWDWWQKADLSTPGKHLASGLQGKYHDLGEMLGYRARWSHKASLERLVIPKRKKTLK